MLAVPSFDSAPPLSLPVRFFIAAGGWLLLLAVAWAAAGDDSYPSLALLLPLHLLTLGVLGNAMLGALLQLLAVVAGVGFARPAWWRDGLWGLWQLATACLCLGFARQLDAAWLQAASVLFLSAGALLLRLWYLLWRSPAADGSSAGLRLALACLLATLLLGVSMLAVLAWGRAWPLLTLLSLHRLAAQGGVLLLVAAVAQTILPMFLLTPAYPGWWPRYLLPAWVLLLLQAAAGMLSMPSLPWLLLAWLPLPLLLWQSWRQLRLSRRPQEWMLPYWRLALWWLLPPALLFPWALLMSPAPWLVRLLGWSLLGGFALTLVVGMLYRIVPFLLWLHLKNLAPPRSKVPAMHAFVPEPAARQGWRLLLALQLAALLWALRPTLAWLPALASIALLAVLAWHYLRAARLWLAERRRLRDG